MNIYLLAAAVTFLLTACIGSNIKEVDTEQSAEMLTCMGFCYQVELGAAAEAIAEDDVADIEDALEDIKMIEEATQEDLLETREHVEKTSKQVEKVRKLDKAIYRDAENEDIREAVE
jgi:hypothetical protein